MPETPDGGWKLDDSTNAEPYKQPPKPAPKKAPAKPEPSQDRKRS